MLLKKIPSVWLFGTLFWEVVLGRCLRSAEGCLSLSCLWPWASHECFKSYVFLWVVIFWPDVDESPKLVLSGSSPSLASLGVDSVVFTVAPTCLGADTNVFAMNLVPLGALTVVLTTTPASLDVDTIVFTINPPPFGADTVVFSTHLEPWVQIPPYLQWVIHPRCKCRWFYNESGMNPVPRGTSVFTMNLASLGAATIVQWILGPWVEILLYLQWTLHPRA